MISRSSIRNLSQTIVFLMSKKKTTQQYRKPIEQLKQEYQQSRPKPNIDQAMKIGRELLEKEQKRIQQARESRSTKNLFKKQSQKQTAEDQTNKANVQKSDRNWLEFQQIPDSNQLAQLIHQALNNLQHKNTKDIKNVLTNIRSKFGVQGYESVLNALFKKDFSKTYTLLREEENEITRLPSRVLTTMFLHLAENQELGKLESLFGELEKAKTLLEYRYEQFFDILFFKQTSRNVKFLAGENSVNINDLGAENKALKSKIILSTRYLRILSENGKKKKSLKKSQTIPQWFDKVSKVILQHKFAVNEFRVLLSEILIKNQFVLPEWFYESQSFSVLLKEFYFGEQQNLQLVLRVFQKNTRNIKFSVFHRNFTYQLMSYRIENQRPAFEVDEVLIKNYKKAFESKNKYLAILCAVIASDARYVNLAEHYNKYYMQGFLNESLANEDLKFIDEVILNNYNRVEDAQSHQKNINKLSKGGNNTLMKIKAMIKLGELTSAWKILEDEVFKKVAIQRQRKNIQFILRSRLGEKSANYLSVKQVTEFITSLNDEYLWTLHRNSEDISVMLKNYLPEDKFSFWEEHEKKARFNEISAKIHSGDLNKIKQPVIDVEADGFSMDQYLESEYPELKQLEQTEYTKRKQLIRYTLKVQALQALSKIQSDTMIIQKLRQQQQKLSQENLQILQNFGLKDYSIPEYGWNHFEKRFENMKIFNYVSKDERLDFAGYRKFLERSKSLSKKSIIEEMMMKCPEEFRQAQKHVKLNAQPIVERLLIWGVYTNQPMAIYLGEKLAMQTGQLIPHELALKVSKTLSHKRLLSDQFITRCKQCLRIVGKIDREFIYSFDKQYEHILVRNDFVNFVDQYFKDRKSQNDVEDLISYAPRRQLQQKQPRFFEESIKSRSNIVV